MEEKLRVFKKGFVNFFCEGLIVDTRFCGLHTVSHPHKQCVKIAVAMLKIIFTKPGSKLKPTSLLILVARASARSEVSFLSLVTSEEYGA